MTLLLLRHGETDAVGHWLSGRMDGVPLNARGRAQAVAIADSLAAVRLSRLIVSPLQRAAETGAPLASRQRLAPEVDPRLTDVDFGAWTGWSFARLEEDPRWHAFNADRVRAKAPSGESLREVQRRTLAVLHELAASSSRGILALVTHAEVVRSAFAALMELSLDSALAIDVPLASVTVLRSEGGALVPLRVAVTAREAADALSALPRDEFVVRGEIGDQLR
jgi:probable phosphoglycerate mutase